MGDTFYGIELVSSSQVHVLGRPEESLQAWRALDAGRPITFVRSRPDIIALHLGGSMYCSNIPALEADLRSMTTRAPQPGELRLLELRHVENGRIPLGIFEPLEGWPLQDVIGFVRTDVQLAAAIALQIYRSYSGGANIVTPVGTLVRQVLPEFEQIEEQAAPSDIGGLPQNSIIGRIEEARRILATVGGLTTRGELDADTEAASAALETELTGLADGVSLGSELAHVLATRYGYVSPY